MEQQIRFCTTPDGTQLAYAMYDEGGKTPLVIVPDWASSQESFWELPEGRAFYERLGRGRKLVTFDRRGLGASQREVRDLSLDAQRSDLGAIVDHLKLGRFDVLSFDSPTAVPFAAQNPERVRRLILWGPSGPAGAEDAARLQAPRSMVELIRSNWQLARRSMAGLQYPNGPVEKQRWWSTVLRESASPEVAARNIEFRMTFDPGPFLSRVKAPTLILHRRRSRVSPISEGRAIAARIPDARFVALEGEINTPMAGDHLQIAELIVNFLDEGEEEQAPAAAPTGLVTILFTDMESSTALTQRLGDAGAQEVRRAHNTIVRTALADHSGHEIKHTGDGIMASFSTASSGLGSAIDIQRAVAAHVEQHPDSPLGVYIGLNAGEPIAEEGDLFGTSINLAARICDHAEPGQIVASNVVRELAAGKDFLFSDLGETELRGFEDPIKLWELRWREQA